jgi:hypothetical protein
MRPTACLTRSSTSPNKYDLWAMWMSGLTMLERSKDMRQRTYGRGQPDASGVGPVPRQQEGGQHDEDVLEGKHAVGQAHHADHAALVHRDVPPLCCRVAGSQVVARSRNQHCKPRARNLHSSRTELYHMLTCRLLPKQAVAHAE